MPIKPSDKGAVDVPRQKSGKLCLYTHLLLSDAYCAYLLPAVLPRLREADGVVVKFFVFPHEIVGSLAVEVTAHTTRLTLETKISNSCVRNTYR